ncbi:MAG: NAD(P)H-dependent oxidoreductase [Anaeromyxobacter sp.]
MATLRLGVITASTRDVRMGEKVARWFRGVAARRPELEVVELDLKVIGLPFLVDPRHPKVAEHDWPRPEQRAWVAAVSGCDAFAIVTPEYNHGYPGALKNALDHAYAGWNGKPVGFVSYGGVAGGVRAVEQLRQVIVELQMAAVRDEVNIPFVGRALDETGSPRDPHHLARAEALLDQLLWWGETLRAGRAARTFPPPPR